MNRQTTIETLDKLSETAYFRLLLDHAQEQNYSFALWRLPDGKTKNLILSFSANVLEPQATVEDLAPGFMFAPFDKSKNRYFLNADLIFSFSEGSLEESQTPQQTSSQERLNNIISKASHPSIKKPHSGKAVASESATKERYQQLVQQGIEAIDAGRFEKIVPSRTKQITLPEQFDEIETFQKLCAAYPKAMISFIHIPTVGTWMGATPEVLIQVENNHIFRTVALAGTKPFEPGTNIKNVAWTQKEIEEQALVGRYIISNFKKIRLREYDEQGPKTIVAGNLMHLKTTYTVDMQETNFPQLGSVMLQLIHPTSAVCGMPLEESISFLKENEGYDREFYAGYLGPVNIDNNICLFVNLRCMQVMGNQAILYAGAGVTADSVPESEWEETEIKFNTLLKVIHS